MKTKINISRKVHKGYLEWKKLPIKIRKKLLKPNGWFGKYQYFYESPKGIISLIKLNDYHVLGEDIYEIYCIDGVIDLKEEIPDTESFSSKKEAEVRIKELLENNNIYKDSKIK